MHLDFATYNMSIISIYLFFGTLIRPSPSLIGRAIGLGIIGQGRSKAVVAYIGSCFFGFCTYLVRWYNVRFYSVHKRAEFILAPHGSLRPSSWSVCGK